MQIFRDVTRPALLIRIVRLGESVYLFLHTPQLPSVEDPAKCYFLCG